MPPSLRWHFQAECVSPIAWGGSEQEEEEAMCSEGLKFGEGTCSGRIWRMKLGGGGGWGGQRFRSRAVHAVHGPRNSHLLLLLLVAALACAETQVRFSKISIAKSTNVFLIILYKCLVMTSVFFQSFQFSCLPGSSTEGWAWYSAWPSSMVGPEQPATSGCKAAHVQGSGHLSFKHPFKCNSNQVQLTCKATGNPAPDIRWMKDGVRIEENPTQRPDYFNYYKVGCPCKT